MGTFAPDISYYNKPINDSFALPFFTARISDGTFLDPQWGGNSAWGKKNAGGKIIGFNGYHVYRAISVSQQFEFIQQHCPSLSPRQGAMIDIESWKGTISGNHSPQLNQLAGLLAGWLGSWNRVIAYGNQGDLNSLFPDPDPRIRFILAGYGSKPSHANMLGWQYSDGDARWSVPTGWARGTAPFGNCDMNYFSLNPADLAVSLGFVDKTDVLEGSDMTHMVFKIDPDSVKAAITDTTVQGLIINAIFTDEGSGVHWLADRASYNSLLAVRSRLISADGKTVTGYNESFTQVAATITFDELTRRLLEANGPGSSVVMPTGMNFGSGVGVPIANTVNASLVPLPGLRPVVSVAVLSGGTDPTTPTAPVVAPRTLYTRPETGTRAFLVVGAGASRRWVSGSEAHSWAEGYNVVALQSNDPFWALPSLSQVAEDQADIVATTAASAAAATTGGTHA